MQLRVGGERRFRLAIGHHGGGFIPLVHLDPVAVELVFLERNRLPQRLALRLGLGACVTAFVHVLLHHHRIDRVRQTQSLKDRPEFADRLVGAGDDLLGNRRTLCREAVQQPRTGLAFQNMRELPRQVERILNRGVRSQPVRRRMPVRRIAHHEHPVGLHPCRVDIVDSPIADRGQIDLDLGVADQRPDDSLSLILGQFRARLRDVIAPDDQPFIPRPHHPHHTHADAADVRPRL